MGHLTPKMAAHECHIYDPKNSGGTDGILTFREWKELRQVPTKRIFSELVLLFLAYYVVYYTIVLTAYYKFEYVFKGFSSG